MRERDVAYRQTDMHIWFDFSFLKCQLVDSEIDFVSAHLYFYMLIWYDEKLLECVCVHVYVCLCMYLLLLVIV